MSGQQTGGTQHNTGTGGPHGGPGIGQIIGTVFIGTSSQERGQRSLVWNWVPCTLVFTASVVALAREPEGPGGQFLWVYVLLLVSFLVAFLRSVVGIDWSRASRATVSWASVIVSVLCCLAMEDLREHGDIDAMQWISVTSWKNLKNGKVFDVELKDDAPRRGHLTLALDADEAKGAEDIQICRPATRLVVPDTGNGPNAASELNTSHELPVGDHSARFSITLKTEKGCEMDVSVTRAVLHD